MPSADLDSYQGKALQIWIYASGVPSRHENPQNLSP
jgi:hypothetical protein